MSSGERQENYGRVLDFIREYKSKLWLGSYRGVAPTLREIAEGCGIPSYSHVNYILEALERDGHIERVPGRGRGIFLRGERWLGPGETCQ